LPLVPLNLANDCAGVCFASFTELDECRANLDQIALYTEQSGNGSTPGRRYFDHCFVCLDRDERLIGYNMISLVDQPSHDFGLLETLTEIWQSELASHDEPMQRTATPCGQQRRCVPLTACIGVQDAAAG
jgi:hypothetical protein